MGLAAVALAAMAAVGWGASDYFGGDASRAEVPVFVVVAVAELIGVVLLVPALVARGVAPPTNPRLLLAAVAGVTVTIELSLIYRALSHGQAFITAPVGALGSVFAVAVGLTGGERLGPEVAVGLSCAVAGGGISSWSSGADAGQGSGRTTQAMLTCVAAAAAVGATLSCLHAAAQLDPYWAAAVMHLSTSLSAAGAAVVGARGGHRSMRSLIPDRARLPKLALIAVVGVVGDVAYAIASHRGALAIVAAVSSLYPVTTIALGRLLGRSHPTRLQLAGIVLGLCGGAVLGAATG
jgi:drug/metabolite transporter (DMT)-like permease